MAYSAPLSERIRIQLEIFCENCTDCFASLSQNYKRPVLILSGMAVLLTMRASRRGIKSAKMGGIMGGTGYSGSSYGGYGSTKKKGFLSKFRKTKQQSSSYGGYGAAGGYGAGGTGSSMYGVGAGSSYGAAAGGGLGSYGAAGGAAGSTYGAGLRGATAMGGGASAYGSSLGGGASSFGGASSMTMGGMGGAAAGGKSTATLADSNPTSIVTLDPSIHFYDYGGSTSFFGQIETVQAYDAPNFVSQVLNQPGQNKVLVIDGGGIRPDMGAVFDGDMANAALRNGWKGVIVHGVVRNVAQLQRSQIGVKALGTSPIKGKAAMGQKGMALNVGTTQLQPGWWVYADADGVVVSQTDISGGSFGGGGLGGGASMMSGGFGSAGGMTGGGATNSMGGGMGGYGSAAGSTMGGAGGFGAAANTGGMGGAAGGLAGGYGNTAGRTTLGGGYGAAAGGGGMTGAGGGGLTGGYGSAAGAGSTYGSAAGGLGGSSRLGGYGAGSTTGYGAGGTSSYGAYGNPGSSLGSTSYGQTRKKKNKVFKMLLASSIAA
eukprot:CAMPEP_0172326002 /NCGR_PEP_ID=MMETSP1058-20130122/55296_1 /TAXON_ID=83371 /ORGANISM="Detonula confervacea, Strain CCMP 353" /LENGTH=543 /DNA_ID=CAMNT_0013042677 /DNA_START=548 /DNA_END=2175 /DNA_ORIENTATION=+